MSQERVSPKERSEPLTSLSGVTRCQEGYLQRKMQQLINKGFPGCGQNLLLTLRPSRQSSQVNDTD